MSKRVASETIRAIDSRPSTGEVLGLGSTSRLYRIHPTTGVATSIGAQFGTALVGTAFGLDLHPGTELLLVTSNSNQSLTVNPDTGAATVNVALSAPVMAVAASPSARGTVSPTILGVDTTVVPATGVSRWSPRSASTSTRTPGSTPTCTTRCGGPSVAASPPTSSSS